MTAVMKKIYSAAGRCLQSDELKDCAKGCRYGRSQMCQNELMRDLLSAIAMLDAENAALKRENYDIRKGRQIISNRRLENGQD